MSKQRYIESVSIEIEINGTVHHGWYRLDPRDYGLTVTHDASGRSDYCLSRGHAVEALAKIMLYQLVQRWLSYAEADRGRQCASRVLLPAEPNRTA